MPQSRSSRSDEGVMALTRDIFKRILGLSEQTTDRMIGIIKNTGQFQDMKLAIRTMSGVSHRRLNDIIDRIEHAGVHGEFDKEDAANDLGAHDHDDHEHDMHDHDAHDQELEAPVRETFVNYLLSELQYSDEDLRDPEKKQEIMRLMRAGDSQADQLIKRGTQKQKQETRTTIQQETDPRKSNLRRKRQRLTKQITMIDKDLGGEPAEADTESTI